MSQRKLTIAVIGARQPSDQEAALAEQTGKEIALHGAVLVCGGLGGTMEAACRGANEAGGLTVGILPGSDPNAANQYVSIPVATGTGLARNMAVVQSAHAVIAIGGSYGTLSEIAYALAGEIPVIGLGTWHFSREATDHDPIIRAGTPLEAVERAIESAEKGR